MIETLTISFHYPLVPGTDIRVPEMTISDSLSSLAIGSSHGTKTVGEVKTAIKSLTRAMLMVVQDLDDLPGKPVVGLQLADRH